jgi:hypothetical protein
MFGSTNSCPVLETSLKISGNCSPKTASYSVLSEPSKYASDLTAPLYGVTSKSSSTLDSLGNKGSSNALKTACSGGVSLNLKEQINAHVAKYSSQLNAAGYGGSVSTGGSGSSTKNRHFNQGLGNGAEGGDPGKSAPHGGSNDELGRTPGQPFSPLPKIQALGKSFSNKCCDVKNAVTTLFNPAPQPTSTISAAGYGGPVSTGGTGSTIKNRHFNQGLGNGAEGGDPGKSAPHGGSNDELGRTPGQKWVPTLVATGKH